MNQQQVPEFIVSNFEHSAIVPMDERTLESVRLDRQARGIPTDLSNLTSPGRYKLTADDNRISNRNTSYLFKNLFGDTLLTDMFFSKKNIENIQNLIKFLVYREIQEVIDEQSYNEVMIVMRGVFLEYHAHPPLLEKNMSQEQRTALLGKYTKEVSRLNEIVLNIIVPRVVSQLQQYKDYLRDASSAPVFLEQPKNDSVAGQREYRSITQVLLGGDL